MSWSFRIYNEKLLIKLKNNIISRPYFSKGRAVGMSCRPSVVRL